MTDMVWRHQWLHLRRGGWLTLYIGGIWNPIWGLRLSMVLRLRQHNIGYTAFGEGEVVGVSNGTIRKSDGGFP